MAKIIWTEPALNDLLDIAAFIAKDSPAYAEKFAIRAVEAPRHLEKFPLIGRKVPEFDDDCIREIIYGSYRIIYLIRESTCYITTVMHGSRDLLRHVKPGDWDIT